MGMENVYTYDLYSILNFVKCYKLHKKSNSIGCHFFSNMWCFFNQNYNKRIIISQTPIYVGDNY